MRKSLYFEEKNIFIFRELFYYDNNEIDNDNPMNISWKDKKIVNFIYSTFKRNFEKLQLKRREKKATSEILFRNLARRFWGKVLIIYCAKFIKGIPNRLFLENRSFLFDAGITSFFIFP